MSISAEPKPVTPGASDDFSRPVVKPKKSVFKLLGEVLEHGGPGYLQFAITKLQRQMRFLWFRGR